MRDCIVPVPESKQIEHQLTPGPCQFCGSDAVHLGHATPPPRSGYAVHCTKCGVVGPDNLDSTVAITRWDGRLGPDALLLRELQERIRTQDKMIANLRTLVSILKDG